MGAGLLEFANVVKASQSGQQAFVVTPKDEIGAAAKELSEAAYPFLKSIDWKSDLYIQPLPGVTAKQALKAVDKAIVSMDTSGVTSLEDFTAVNAAIGRMIASTPT